MIRTLNVMAILALIGSATMLYQVKYETILVNEKLRKAESALQKEKDAIAILKAEWELFNRPARLAMLAQPEPGMQTISVRQIAKAGDIPKATGEQDKIGAALDGLMTGSLPPSDAQKKITPRPTTPLAATPRPRSTVATPRPDTRGPKTATSARPLPRVATTTPLSLRPPANLGSTRPAQKRDPIADMLRPPAPLGQPRR